MTAEEQKMEIGLVVNGQEIGRSVNPKMSLMRFLRDDLELTGTKEGCTTGDCGTCVVLVDGEPVDSCLLLRSHGYPFLAFLIDPGSLFKQSSDLFDLTSGGRFNQPRTGVLPAYRDRNQHRRSDKNNDPS